jgi:mycothiol system anti-sigma-R factor
MSCGNPHKVPCSEILEQVYAYLDREISEAECEEIREHLEECGPCLREYGLEKAVKALVAKHCGCDPAPADLRTKVLVRISQVRAELEVADLLTAILPRPRSRVVTTVRGRFVTVC